MDDLWKPMTFPGGARARNALWLAPLTNQQSAPDGLLSEAERRWLVRRAEGGFGVIVTAAAYVLREGQTWPGQLGIDRSATLPALRDLADRLHAAGALGIVQLYHGGARATPALCGAAPWSASAFTSPVTGDAIEAGSEQQITRVIQAFRDAALRAADAGMDGVELHGAHGYLLGQFLSRVLNTRDDAWGGADLQARARLLLDATRAVRAALPQPFVVGVRLSPEDYGMVRGLDLDETATLAGWLAVLGIDYLHLSLWDHHKHSAKYPNELPFMRVRAALPGGVPLVAAGAFQSPSDLTRWTDWTASLPTGDGVAAAVHPVALGLAGILDPAWPRHAEAFLRGDLPHWTPPALPVSEDALHAVDVTPPFIAFLRERKGFIAEK